jgi:hypothetical protein
MRNAALIAPLLLTACAAAPAEPPVRGETPGYACRNDALAAFAGRVADAAVGTEILRASGARTLRWASPGMMVTMEYRADRVTVWLAPGNRIERVSCG